MYIIRILNGENPIFEIVASYESIFPITALIDTNPLTQYKVFGAAGQLMPSDFGFGPTDNWVMKFSHEA